MKRRKFFSLLGLGSLLTVINPFSTLSKASPTHPPLNDQPDLSGSMTFSNMDINMIAEALRGWGVNVKILTLPYYYDQEQGKERILRTRKLKMTWEADINNFSFEGRKKAFYNGFAAHLIGEFPELNKSNHTILLRDAHQVKTTKGNFTCLARLTVVKDQ